MAICKSIRAALDEVFHISSEIDSVFKAFEAVEPDDQSNPIVYMMRKQFDRYTEKCEELETLLRQQVLPLLEDFESVNRSK
jgi:hypothetical protein